MNKTLLIRCLIAVLLLSDCCNNPYHLDIVNTLSEYHESVAADPDNELVDLEVLIPGIVLDIRYADTCNFTHTRIYSEPKAFLRRPAAEALAKAQKELNEAGLGVKIYDAYRPYAATLYFYEVCKDTNFVAYPGTGSIHNRGCAVDLTLIDLATGKELEMPTVFDDFSEKAASGYPDVTQTVLDNRQKLQYVMKKNGFDEYDPEWWHFNLHNSSKFKITDICFEKL